MGSAGPGRRATIGTARTVARTAVVLACTIVLGFGAAPVRADQQDLGASGISGTVRFPPGVGTGRLDEVQVLVFGSAGGLWVTYPDEDGVYHMALEGAYGVRFTAPSDLGLVTEYYPGSYEWDQADGVTVAPGQQVTGVDATFEVGGSITGNVTTPAGLAPPRWDVTATRLDGGPGGAAYIAADGSYVVSGLPPGRYAVLFRGPGIEWWDDATAEAAAQPVSVTLGRATPRVDASLAADAYLDPWSSHPVTADLGAAVTFSVHLQTRMSDMGVTGGTVTFSAGARTLGSAPVVDGWASLVVSDLPAGGNEILLRYSGDATFGPAEKTFTQWVVTQDPPVVTGLDPAAGGPAGGTEVHVFGSGLQGATGVSFGGVPATALSIVSPGELVVTAPPGAVGAVAVRVTTPRGTSPAEGPAFAYREIVTGPPVRVMDVDRAWPGRSCVQVAGTADIPSDATGVIATVTTAAPSGPGYVVAHPWLADAVAEPPGSTVNFEPGREVANAAFVALQEGALCITHRGAERARVIVDVTGYTVAGSGVVTQPSQRLVDTRPGVGHVGDIDGPVPARTVRTVQVAGRAGVPADATHVLLNVTVTGPTTPGNLRVFPPGEQVPNASVVNFAPGADKANATMVRLVDGRVALYSDSPAPPAVSPVQVVLDVVGWVMPGSAMTGTTPTRVLDTRAASAIGDVVGPLAPRTAYSFDLPAGGPVPDDATAVVLNVTAIGPTAPGNLRVFPDAGGGTALPPGTSSLNYIPGRDIPCLVVVALTPDGRIDLYSDSSGTVHVAVDVVGYVGGG